MFIYLVVFIFLRRNMLDYKDKPTSYYFTETDLKKILLEVVPRSEILIPMKRKELIKELENYKDQVVGNYITGAQSEYLKRKKDEGREPEYLTEEDLILIDQYFAKYPNSKVKQTQHAIIKALINGGLRVQELCDFDVNSIDQDLGRIRILGKGKKWRWTHIDQNFIDFLISFKQRYNCDKNPTYKNSYEMDYKPLFLNGDGNPLTPRNIQKFMDTISRTIPNLSRKLHPHLLRHTYAVLKIMKNPTHSIEELRKDMGHENVNTTQIYFSLAEGERIKLANRRRVRDQESELKYCKECGKKIPKDSNFCSFCGGKQE